MKREFENLKFLNSGACSDAYLTNNGRVLLIGKREDSFSLYRSLFQKFKLIDGKITSVKIPDNLELIEPNNQFKNGAMIQNYVEGKEFKEVLRFLTIDEREEIGCGLATFLCELQKIKCNYSKEEEIKINLEKLDKSLKLIKDYVSADDYAKLCKVRPVYEGFMQKSHFCLTHGDLQEANILIGENNKLSGIIDFGNMEYYVPEVEFAPMLGLDDVIFNSMLKHFNSKVEVKNIYLIKIVRQIRHFKHVVSLENEKVQNEINKILFLLKNAK